MGASSSTAEASYCYNCGCSLSEPRGVRCTRCHTSLAFQQHVSSSSSSSSKPQRLRDVLNNNSDQSTMQAPNLEHVWVGTFEESLVGCDEEKEMTCEYLINSYLKPHFARHPNELVYSGVHWVINKIHFKVYSCYPPIGKINSETKYHLEDENNNGQQVLKFHSHLIRRLHILPTLESYNLFQKSREEANNNNNSNNNTNRIRNSPNVGTSAGTGGRHNNEHRHITKKWNEELFDSHIKSFFRSRDIFRNYNNNSNTESGAHSAQTIYEEKESNATTASRRIVERSISPHRHLIAGEVFISKGIQFRVMECEPSDGLVPLIGLDSIVNVHGNPLQDVAHLSLQIPYETLPNDQKQMSPEQFRTQYLDPYFRGRVRYVNRTQELNMFGVKTIFTCEPTDGIITELSKIDFIQQLPLPVDNSRQTQEESDWEMAQRLQREEEEQQRPRVVIRSAEHFQRFLSGLSQSPDRHSGEEQQLALALVQLLQQLQHHNHNGEQQGLPIGAVERLPLYEYKATSKEQEHCVAGSEAGAASEEDRTCRICLVDFENGSKVRWMPCFHRYHRECIDRWLEMNRKCPICKIDVLQTLRQDQDRND